jgi:nucleoside-diphosphate-sugar epimerase
MSIFITGGTGYIGGYVVTRLLRDTNERLALLVRAKSRDDAFAKLWQGLELHMEGPEFWDAVARVDFIHGDLHEPGLGLDPGTEIGLVHDAESVLHIAASLNRKSERACLNTNLRGSLHVIELARKIRDHHGLRRFSHVSTVAVAGQRSHEVVEEDSAIEWNRPDYDPYARTKKFCEYMGRELLEGTPLTFFRPSIVMGDSVKAETTQFDMVRAVCVLADLPVVPIQPESRVDIVNADYVGKAIATLHMRDELEHQIFHLASGRSSCTVRELAGAFARDLGRKYRFAPRLEKTFGRTFDAMNAMPGKNPVTFVGALMKVFWPYITYDTVFDNERVCTAMNESPVPFTDYAARLYHFAKKNDFRYPHRPLPPRPTSVAVPGARSVEHAS